MAPKSCNSSAHVSVVTNPPTSNPSALATAIQNCLDSADRMCPIWPPPQMYSFPYAPPLHSWILLECFSSKEAAIISLYTRSSFLKSASRHWKRVLQSDLLRYLCYLWKVFFSFCILQNRYLFQNPTSSKTQRKQKVQTSSQGQEAGITKSEESHWDLPYCDSLHLVVPRVLDAGM